MSGKQIGKLTMTMKYSYALLFLLTLFACNRSQNKTVDNSQSGPTQMVNSATSSDAIKDYQLFVSKLDTFNVETVTTAAKKYQSLFKNEDSELKDKGFSIFNAYYDRLDKNVNELHENDTTNFDPLIMLDASGKSIPIPKKLKDYNDRLKRNGFEVSSTEGISYIQKDRDFIEKWFYSFVSSSMKEYLQQLNKESKEGFQEDAGLTIAAQQYADRLVWWDNFIQKYPTFHMIENAKKHRKELLTFFVIGMDNSPVLDYETNKLAHYYKNAYTYLQSNYPSSETNKVVNPYFKALLQNDKAKGSALLNKYKKSGVIIDFGENL